MASSAQRNAGSLPQRHGRAKRTISPPSHEWNRHRPSILKLYQTMSLGQVMKQMQGHGFSASTKHYKIKFSEWKVSKADQNRNVADEDGLDLTAVSDTVNIPSVSQTTVTIPVDIDMADTVNHDDSQRLRAESTAVITDSADVWGKTWSANHDPNPQTLATGLDKPVFARPAPPLSTPLTQTNNIHAINTPPAPFQLGTPLGTSLTQANYIRPRNPQLDPVSFSGSTTATTRQKGRQALHQAVLSGSLLVVEQLLRFGADVNAVDEEGISPLHLVAQSNHTAIASRLLQSGAKISAQRYKDQEQPIHGAARSGSLETVELLLAHRASNDALTILGETPLIFAVDRGHHKIAELLLRNTSLVTKADRRSGRQAIHRAAAKGHLMIVSQLIDEDAADINAVDFEGATPLKLAVEFGHISTVSHLLENGAETNISWGDDSLTVMHLAAAKGNVQIVRLLLDYSESTEPELAWGATPLYLAAANGHIKVLKFLLHSKTSNSPPNEENGYSTAMIAAKNGHEACATLLFDVDYDYGDKVVVGKDGTTLLWHTCSASMHALTRRLLILVAKPGARHLETGHSEIHQAAKLGDVETVNLLLNRSADANALSKNLETPLWIAASLGHEEIVDRLLKAGANAHLVDRRLRHAIHAAASGGHLKVVKLLLPYTADVNIDDIDGISPLSIAATNGFTEIVSLLIQTGANVNSPRRSDGYLPIHQAARNGHLEVVKQISKTDPNVDRKATDGTTALWHAVFHSHRELANFLLQHDSVNTSATNNTNRMSVLHCACLLGNKTVFDYVLRHNVRLDDPDDLGRTPLIIASVQGHRHFVDSLLRHGADRFVRSHTGYQAIHGAVIGGSLDVVMLSLSQGAEIDCEDNDLHTPLWLAVRDGNPVLVEFLLAKGASFTGGNDRWQPIHLAASQGHFENVKMLLEHGAEPDTRTADGKTPLWLAAHIGSNEIVTLLLQKNANVHHVRPPPPTITWSSEGDSSENECDDDW